MADVEDQSQIYFKAMRKQKVLTDCCMKFVSQNQSFGNGWWISAPGS